LLDNTFVKVYKVREFNIITGY